MAEETQAGAQSSSQGGSQAGQSGTSQQGSSSQSTQTSQSAEAGTQQQAQAPSRPEYVPESHWDASAGKVKDDKAFSAWVNEHVAFKAAQDSRRLTLPQTPDAYKVELPKDFTPPPGIEYKFNDADPLLSQAKSVMHDIDMGKLSGQEAFSKLLGLYAGAQVSSEQTIAQGRAAEVAKLGAAGTARVTAVNTWLDANGLSDMKSGMITAGHIAGFEKIMAKIQSQGGASFTTNGRQPPEGQKVDSATYDKMTYTQKKEYAAKFPQREGVQ